MTPPLVALCVLVLARFPDELHHAHSRRISPTTAILDAAAPADSDPAQWAALTQLVYPLPARLHDHHTYLSHPALHLLQNVSDSSHFSLLSLLSLPNCSHLRDHHFLSLTSLHRLIAIDLHGCAISSYALTLLARGLTTPSRAHPDPTRSGVWRLRLLSLHGCPNIDNDVLLVLHKFPLLSAVDLRFTRCTPAAVNARLSPLNFRPSDNNSLFHPAPLSLALCSLEKIALTASDPISLYSCPLQSVFRLHIDNLDHHPSHTKKTVPLPTSSTSHSMIRTLSSAEDAVVFLPPLRKPAKSESFPPSKSFTSSTPLAVVSPTLPQSRSTDSGFVSNVTTFYDKATAPHRISWRSILPLSAQVVQSFEDGKLDPLAVARSPPPWTTLDAYKFPTSSTDNETGRSLSDSLKVDRARLHKRNSDAIADIVHQFTSKRPRIVSEFVLEKARSKVSAKLRNPFAKSAKSVFAESGTTTFDGQRPLVHESPKAGEPNTQVRTCRSLPSKIVPHQKAIIERTSKPLKPITMLKPPILPKEFLPSLSRPVSNKPRNDLKQARLTFS